MINNLVQLRIVNNAAASRYISLLDNFTMKYQKILVGTKVVYISTVSDIN